jgi:pilus assembly protein CpaE
VLDKLPVSPIRALVLDDSPDGREVIADLLRAEAGFSVAVASVAFGEGIRVAHQAEPDVIVLVADNLVGSDPLLAIDDLEAAVPGAVIIVLAAVDATKQRELILAGARDCLAPPYTRGALIDSIRKLHLRESRRRERLAATLNGGMRRHRCQVIAFHGAKGGVGTTSLAVGTAVTVRKITGHRVAIVDASLQTGDVGVALNVSASTGIDDLLPHLNELDLELLNKILVAHPTGVRALLAPRDLERAEAIGAEELRRILVFLASLFEYVVIDTASALDLTCLAALDHADRIVLVTTPEIPALRHAGRFLQLSRRLGYPQDKVGLVVNRASARQGIRLADIETQLGLKPLATIPKADRAFLHATNHGEVIDGSVAVLGPGRSLGALARKLVVSRVDARRGSVRGRLAAATRSLLRRTRTEAHAGLPPGASMATKTQPS